MDGWLSRQRGIKASCCNACITPPLGNTVALHAAVSHTLQDCLSAVLVAYADALLAAHQLGDSGLLQGRVNALKRFVLDLDSSISPQVYAHINTCVREYS